MKGLNQLSRQIEDPDSSHIVQMRKLSYDEVAKCNKCGFCLPSCPTYMVMKGEAYSPRGRNAITRWAALMDLTGEAEGSPQVLGVPLPDMGSSEQVYGLAMRALYKRAVTGFGSRIDFSMFKSSVSWHAINIPMTASFNKKLTRRGNTHEFFAPVSVFATKDGFVYLAVGNDRQWQALTGLEGFKKLDQECYRNNSGRIADVKNLNRMLNEITAGYTGKELLSQLTAITVPASKINSLSDLVEDELIKGDLLSATDPESGRNITLSPPPHTTDYIKECNQKLSCPPRLGEHNNEIYGAGLGLLPDEMENLREEKII